MAKPVTQISPEATKESSSAIICNWLSSNIHKLSIEDARRKIEIKSCHTREFYRFNFSVVVEARKVKWNQILPPALKGRKETGDGAWDIALPLQKNFIGNRTEKRISLKLDVLFCRSGCTTCNQSGMVACEACGGTSEISCPTCLGGGSVATDSSVSQRQVKCGCNGGRNDFFGSVCGKCNGAGWFVEDHIDYKYSPCHNPECYSGRMRCGVCNQGQVHCRECTGLGELFYEPTYSRHFQIFDAGSFNGNASKNREVNTLAVEQAAKSRSFFIETDYISNGAAPIEFEKLIKIKKFLKSKVNGGNLSKLSKHERRVALQVDLHSTEIAEIKYALQGQLFTAEIVGGTEYPIATQSPISEMIRLNIENIEKMLEQGKLIEPIEQFMSCSKSIDQVGKERMRLISLLLVLKTKASQRLIDSLSYVEGSSRREIGMYIATKCADHPWSKRERSRRKLLFALSSMFPVAFAITGISVPTNSFSIASTLVFSASLIGSLIFLVMGSIWADKTRLVIYSLLVSVVVNVSTLIFCNSRIDTAISSAVFVAWGTACFSYVAFAIMFRSFIGQPPQPEGKNHTIRNRFLKVLTGEPQKSEDQDNINQVSIIQQLYSYLKSVKSNLGVPSSIRDEL